MLAASKTQYATIIFVTLAEERDSDIFVLLVLLMQDQDCPPLNCPPRLKICEVSGSAEHRKQLFALPDCQKCPRKDICPLNARKSRLSQRLSAVWPLHGVAEAASPAFHKPRYRSELFS